MITQGYQIVFIWNSIYLSFSENICLLWILKCCLYLWYCRIISEKIDCQITWIDRSLKIFCNMNFLRQEDSGMFECMADNEAGDIVGYTWLRVKSKSVYPCRNLPTYFWLLVFFLLWKKRKMLVYIASSRSVIYVEGPELPRLFWFS